MRNAAFWERPLFRNRPRHRIVYVITALPCQLRGPPFQTCYRTYFTQDFHPTLPSAPSFAAPPPFFDLSHTARTSIRTSDDKLLVPSSSANPIKTRSAHIALDSVASPEPFTRPEYKTSRVECKLASVDGSGGRCGSAIGLHRVPHQQKKDPQLSQASGVITCAGCGALRRMWPRGAG